MDEEFVNLSGVTNIAYTVVDEIDDSLELLPPSFEGTIEVQLEEVFPREVLEAFGITETFTSPKFDVRGYFESEIHVQVKTHRKKRINKKWAKRYGFHSVKVRIPFELKEVISYVGESKETLYLSSTEAGIGSDREVSADQGQSVRDGGAAGSDLS